MAFSKVEKRKKIHYGIRSKIKGTADRPRLSVYKSNTSIYVQLIDDLTGHTLAAASSKELDLKGKNVNVTSSKEVGKKIAERAVANGIQNIVFDRSGYKYHGRVKALAEGAREGGLKF
jgi:large subunit ribosomal protein L18